MTMRHLLACALALMLPACTPPLAVRPPVATPAPVVQAKPAPADTRAPAPARAFAAAEIEWQSAIAVGRQLVASGVIRGGTATTVREWNAKARALIVMGKATTDVVVQAHAAAGLFALVAKLDAITGRK